MWDPSSLLGIEPSPPALEAQSLNHWTAREVPVCKCFMYFPNKNVFGENSLVVQWLGLHILTAEGPGSIPGQGTKILQAAQHGGGEGRNRYMYMYN